MPFLGVTVLDTPVVRYTMQRYVVIIISPYSIRDPFVTRGRLILCSLVIVYVRSPITDDV